MTRKQKYPDTKTFHYHNENPKGRITSDCVTRAIARATGVPYAEVVLGLSRLMIDTGYEWTDKKTINAYLESLGWVIHKQPRKADGTKYTGREFCQEIMRYDCEIDGEFDIHRIIANIGGNHMVAIIEGQVNDIWNSTGGCIGNFWTKD